MDRRDLLTIPLPKAGGTIRGESPLSGRVAGRDASQNQPEYARRSDTDLTPYSGQWTWREAAHLLRRGMIGPTEQEINQAVADGMVVTLAKLMSSFSPLPDGMEDWADQTDFQIRPDTGAGEDYTMFQQGLFERRDEFIRWTLLNIARSPVSMQERLRLFWHNHFTTELQVVVYPEMLLEQYRLFARNMLGNFKSFVYDVTIDMAMLHYLDGIRSYKAGNTNNINENYARELMELFTMGVFSPDGKENYTQQDVIAAAQALSGWNYDADLTQSRTWVRIPRTAKFYPYLWDSGQKTLLGKTGSWDAQDVIDIIFEQRAAEVAHFICSKIYRGFVYDIPDPVVVDQMAATFRNSGWELRPVFEELLKSQHFYDVTNIGAMHKGPVDYILGMARGLGLTSLPGLDETFDARVSRDLVTRLSTMGQVPYYPPNVKGWPGGRTWTSTSTVPLRQKFGIDVAAGAIVVRRDVYYELDPIAFARSFSDPYDIHLLSEEMARFLLNSEPSELESTLLYETLLDGGKDYEWDLDDQEQRPEERIRKFMQAAAQLAKYQLY